MFYVQIMPCLLYTSVLSDLRPDLQAGVYMSAPEGFGSFIGFNVAWGYWLMTAFGNVAFAVILMDAFNQFMPCLLYTSRCV